MITADGIYTREQFRDAIEFSELIQRFTPPGPIHHCDYAMIRIVCLTVDLHARAIEFGQWIRKTYPQSRVAFGPRGEFWWKSLQPDAASVPTLESLIREWEGEVALARFRVGGGR